MLAQQGRFYLINGHLHLSFASAFNKIRRNGLSLCYLLEMWKDMLASNRLDWISGRALSSHAELDPRTAKISIIIACRLWKYSLQFTYTVDKNRNKKIL